MHSTIDKPLDEQLQGFKPTALQLCYAELLQHRRTLKVLICHFTTVLPTQRAWPQAREARLGSRRLCTSAPAFMSSAHILTVSRWTQGCTWLSQPMYEEFDRVQDQGGGLYWHQASGGGNWNTVKTPGLLVDTSGGRQGQLTHANDEFHGPSQALVLTS